MTFLGNHASEDDPLARVLFYSIVLHYILFFIFFGNPFFLNLDDRPEDYGMQGSFDIQLLALPGVDGRALPRQQALALFPPEVARESKGAQAGAGLNPEAFHDKPSEINEAPETPEIAALHASPPLNVTGRDEVLRRGSAQYEGKVPLTEEVQPLITTKRMPPNMSGPEDCMIKVVGMVCPNADAKCIAEYKAFCRTLAR